MKNLKLTVFWITPDSKLLNLVCPTQRLAFRIAKECIERGSKDVWIEVERSCNAKILTDHGTA